MPEVHYTTTVNVSVERVWDFVKDINNWAPLMAGYQAHEIVSETDSLWTLKGDVGVLARRVQLRAHITEWSGPDRVSFTLTGIDEEVEGGGTVAMVAYTGDGGAEAPPGSSRRSVFARIAEAIARFVFRCVHGRGAKRLSPPVGPNHGPMSQLKVTLRMDAGGPTGPLVNAVLGPALVPAAEHLTQKIADRLEREDSATRLKASR